MAFQNNLRQISIILYRLKRSFGQQVIVRKVTSTTVNTQTGAVTQVTSDTTVKRAIVLPARQVQDYVYDLAYIAANKNFTMGGLFDRKDRTVIIEIKDLDGTTIDMEDKIEFGSQLYNIKDITKTEDNKGYLLRVRNIQDETDGS